MSDSRLRRWQKITAGSLFVGYAGYYLGRTCLSIATPLMVDASGDHSLGLEQIGIISSVGVAAYALGKVINGVVVDKLGGRRMFLFGMVATIACTVAFRLRCGIAGLRRDLGREPLLSIDGLAGTRQDGIPLVSARQASDRDGHSLAELSLRRRAHSPLSGRHCRDRTEVLPALRWSDWPTGGPSF